MNKILLPSLVIIAIVLVTYLIYSYYFIEGLTINSVDPNVNQPNVDKLLDSLPMVSNMLAKELPNIIPTIIKSIKSIHTININPKPAGSPDTTLQTLKLNINGNQVQTNAVIGIITNMLNNSIKNIKSIDILM